MEVMNVTKQATDTLFETLLFLKQVSVPIPQINKGLLYYENNPFVIS